MQIEGCALEENGQSGVLLEDTSGAGMARNILMANVIGVSMNHAINSQLTENLVCGNSVRDVDSLNPVSGTGLRNACDNVSGWSDTGTTGCTFTCTSDDNDQDGVPVDVDNCPQTFNPSQSDGDGDGVGDACDCCPRSAFGVMVNAKGCAPFDLGDANGDADITVADWGVMVSCVRGPNMQLPPSCESADLDGDSDSDLMDYAAFQNALCVHH